MSRVLAILAGNEGSIDRSHRELLAAARDAAHGLGSGLAVALLGSSLAPSRGEEAVSYGADHVYLVSDPLLAEDHPDSLLQAAQQLAEKLQPAAVLFIGKTLCLETAPRLAHRLRTGCVLDCVSISVKDGRLVLTKPVYGGKVVARYSARRPPVVVLRTRTVDPAEADPSRSGEVLEFPVSFDPARIGTRVVERVSEEGEGASLEDARVIISGGRGMGGPEPYKMLEELARLLDGTVGASRAACDLGWVPASWQIGQTGKKVAPQLYLAVGISGASQHLVGIAGAKHVVAVNIDASAPIFKVAQLGVVEDYQNLIPHLIEAIRQNRTG